VAALEALADGRLGTLIVRLSGFLKSRSAGQRWLNRNIAPLD
jgi:hypothetical protein